MADLTNGKGVCIIGTLELVTRCRSDEQIDTECRNRTLTSRQTSA